MRESNFSNPIQNKACVCISATVYDRRAIDCTATLPLINSLNHLAYLTSTSPRIRDMVCIDGGLERLIRILRQVPRTPAQPALRGIITKEMQAIWKWSLAFQCVVNIGVRGSENIRVRVVEAGMISVAARVLESYLRIADAIREEKKREAKREEAKLKMERAAEAALLGMPEVTTPTATSSRRGAISHVEGRTFTQGGALSSRGEGSSRNSRSNVVAPPSSSLTGTSSMMENYSAVRASPNNIRNSHIHQVAISISPAQSMDSATPMVTTLDSDSVISASSSSSSVLVNDSGVGQASSSSQGDGGGGGAGRRGEDGQEIVAGYPSGLLTNVSSVEDFTASASGSDGAEDAELEGEESEVDSTMAPPSRSRNGSQDGERGGDNYEVGDGATPRPLRRMLAPLAAGEQRRELPAAWQVVSDAATSVAPAREATIMATPRRNPQTIAEARGRMDQIPAIQVSANAAAAAAAEAGRGHHHHHHHHHHGHHHHHSHRERPAAQQGENLLHPSDMIYREEEVLLSLQLLAYLSKYSHVRTLFHCDLSLLSSFETLDGSITGALRESIQSWNPLNPPKKNVFCIAERYTLRSSRTGLCHFAAHGESRVAPEIQYWAGVVMRNACRKDENQGGIRQCANMLCGKWETQPREFAKCRRCRKAKYCSKQCQSKGWQMGHRSWCCNKSDDEHPDAKDKSKSKIGGVDATTMEEQVPRDVNIDGIARSAHDLPRHNVGVGADDINMQQDQPNRVGHAHVNPAPLFSAARIPQGPSYPGEVSRRHVSTPSSTSQPFGGRRTVSAIPTHLQLPSSSDDVQSGNSRSRTVSTASSGGEMSDVSDDEMERASRRVLASTVSPAQRSPGISLTPLASMTTADEMMMMGMTSTGADHAGGLATTRTDLAGRPLPPPVIAEHGVPQDEMLNMGGRLTPGVQEEHENAVFGRGDIDQMIWRGRTPAAEDPEETRDIRRRGSTVTGRSMAQYRQDVDEDDEAATSLIHHNPGLLLGGGGGGVSSNQSISTSRPLSATPRYSSSNNLHAPVARQPHRFASVAVSSSPIASSSRATVAPHSFVRGSLAGTFGDWRTSSSPLDDEIASIPSSRQQQASLHDDSLVGIGVNNNTNHSSWSSHGSLGRIISAPAHSTSFDSGLPETSNRRSRGVQEDFVVPSEIQNLLNTVESSDEMQVDSV